MKMRAARKMFYLSWIKFGRIINSVEVYDEVIYRYYKSKIKP